MPPVTAERSPPLSRTTGADSPVMADLVDRGDALDDLAVTGDELIRLDETRSPLRSNDDGTALARRRARRRR